MTEQCSLNPFSGWLWVWSSNVGRYEKMWFVLFNGVLMHYTDEEEMANTCQGGISLAGSIMDFDETCKFVVCQDGQAYHIKAENRQDKERWMDALMTARDVAQQSQDSIHTGTGVECTNQARTCLSVPPENSLELRVLKQVGKCSREQAPGSSNIEAELAELTVAAGTKQNQDEKLINDELLAAGSNYVPAEMITSQDPNIAGCAFASAIRMEPHEMNITCKAIQCQSHSDKRQAAFPISTIVQKLKVVQTKNDLVNKCNLDLQTSINAIGTHQENDIFQDVSHQATKYQLAASAMTSACIDYTHLVESYSRQWITLYLSEHEQRVKLEQVVKALTQAPSNSSEFISEDEEILDYYDCCDTTNASDQNYVDVTLQVYQVIGGTSGNRTRRTRIPDRPNVSDSLWSVLKHCIGNDLSKMPLPVSFAEPLSLLQRLTEDFEYAEVLNHASDCTDPAIQIAYVAAFMSSSYSTTIGRSGKPFNPLLGETYECDRESDLGWKSIAEQVSHHPPVAAVYCESKNWEYWMDQSLKSKFKGTTLTIIPLGECHLSFRNGNRYSWKKPNTSIHNVIVGKLWVEQEGDVDIKCHTTNFTCKLSFVSSGWTGDNFTLRGVIKDDNGKAIYDIVGRYSTQIDYRPAGSKDPGTVVWRRTEPPADNAKYYSFTILACQLNEMEDGVAPTDSRLRPDQRLMEEGNFDAANAMKKKLEEFQRANKKELWTPTWFHRKADPDTKTEMWTYRGDYWSCKTKKDWSHCPSHIFSPP